MGNQKLSKVTSTIILTGFALATACNSPNSGGIAASPVCSQAVAPVVQDHAGFLNQSGLQQLHGHVPSLVARSHDLGKMSDADEVPVTIALNLNNAKGLAQLLSDVYQPGNPIFHQFLKPEDFRNQFGPTATQVADVQNYLQSQGLHSISVDPNGFLIHASGAPSKLNSAFNTEVHQYNDPNGKSFFAPAYEIQVPQGLAIQAVHGLENQSHWHNYAVHSDAAENSHGGSGPSGGLSPTDIRKAYNLPTNLDGTGQTLAVFELDGYTASDISGYEKNFSLSSVPLQNVLIDGATGSPGGGAGEVTLDIELMIAVAPKASKIYVYEGVNSSQGILDTYSKIANDNLAKSISTSWGSSEDSNTQAFAKSENTIFMQMAAQGQSIFSAAGDSGAYDDGSKLSVDDPSGQPYMTGVGGTTLTLSGSGGYGSETTWSNGGGGVSANWSLPTWQKGLATSANKASSTMRNVPDVALNADPNTGYSIYLSGGWGVWGGTSCAAPLWAGFTALANQARAANGLGTLGFANPLIYQIAESNRYNSDFHDIADGSTNGYYPAVTGYDDATGWGSFDAANLVQDLSSNAAGVPGSPVGGSPSPVSCSSGS